MLLILALSNVSFAGESVKNAHKGNGAGDTISHADTTGHVDGNFSSAVKANISYRQKINNDILATQQMLERQRKMQEAQQEIFKRYIQERRQLTAVYNQTQRKAFIKLMEERRTLMKKMMDEHRQAAEERRKTMLLKMHQTSTTPARHYS
jgi:Skp family chaperone for outer membrane proteins